jgi:hypothetical protein
MSITIRAVVATLLVATAGVAAGTADGPFDKPVQFSASKILPAEIVSGPNHRVDDSVRNDGFLNLYRIKSKWGELSAVSTPTLYKRVHELNAMAAMEMLQGSEEFQKGLTERAEDFIDGGKAIITDPVGSVGGVVSGIGKLFGGALDTVQHGRSDTEAGLASSLTGFDKVRREYAKQFRVDPYSRNQYLQDELTKISENGFVGNAIVSISTVAISGGAGVALTATGTTENLREALTLKSASLLRSENKVHLQSMGVSNDVVDLFLGNKAYTISQSTGLVHALLKMKRTDKRPAFVKLAVLSNDDDVAAFRQRQASMYASYNVTVEPIEAFEFLGRTATARTQSGKVVFCVPLDHLLWTNAMSALIRSANERVGELPGVKGKELWISGTVSARARQHLNKLGWVVEERSPLTW